MVCGRVSRGEIRQKKQSLRLFCRFWRYVCMCGPASKGYFPFLIIKQRRNFSNKFPRSRYPSIAHKPSGSTTRIVDFSVAEKLWQSPVVKVHCRPEPPLACWENSKPNRIGWCSRKSTRATFAVPNTRTRPAHVWYVSAKSMATRDNA